MSIATTCPKCNAPFRIPEELAGKKVKCERCAQIFSVPTADANGESDREAPKSSPAKVHDGAVMADDDLPASRKGKAPTAKNSTEAPKDIRRKQQTGASTGMIVLMVILIGGGLLTCAGASGLGGWYYFEHNKPKAAEPKALAAEKDAINKDADNKEAGNKEAGNKDAGNKEAGAPPAGKKVGGKGGKAPGPPPIPAAPPLKGIIVVFGPDGKFSSNETLDKAEMMAYEKRLKLYLLQMEAGKTYQIDMLAVAPGLDPYLRLLDEKNTEVVEAGDGGEGRNARVVFVAPRNGLYRVHATYAANMPKGPADYTLVVTRRDAKK